MSRRWLLLGVLLALLTSSARTQQSDCFYFYNPASLVVYRIPSTSSLCTNSTFTFQNWDYYRNRWKGNLTFLPERKTISLSNNGSSPSALDEAYATSLFDQKWTVLPGNQEKLPMFQVRQSSSLDTGQFYWNFEGNTIDPGPFAGDPGLYLVANPNDLIIEDSGLGFFFSYYLYVVLGIAIIAAAVSPLYVPIVSIGLQTCLLFTAICSALIKIGYTEGISIALGSLVAAGLACFLVSRLEESQQFKAAQISTFISMAISLVTVSYCDLACLLVIGGIQWMVYNKKVASSVNISSEGNHRLLMVFRLNLMFITYLLMCLIMFSRTPITAISRAYRCPFSMYPAGLFSLLVSFLSLSSVAGLNGLLNRKSNLEKVVPTPSTDLNQGLNDYTYH